MAHRGAVLPLPSRGGTYMNEGRPAGPRLEAGTIAPIANAVRTRMASAMQVVDEAFRRIETVDTRLHAFCTLDPEGARKAAEDLDRRLARGERVGPLAGVPVAIKDLIS